MAMVIIEAGLSSLFMLRLERFCRTMFLEALISGDFDRSFLSFLLGVKLALGGAVPYAGILNRQLS